MSANRPTQANAVDLPHLARVVRRGDLVIGVRCYAIPSPEGERFEVLLWGNGNRGIVDIPGSERGRLEERIAFATEVFARTICARRNQSEA